MLNNVNYKVLLLKRKRYLIAIGLACAVLLLITVPFSRGNNIGIQGPDISLHSVLNRKVVFNVKDYGATGEGKINDAASINKAIEAAFAEGGGTVYFPAGTYLTGSIHLKSNITLYLSQGCTIVAISDPSAYDSPEPNPYDEYQDFGHSHWHNSLIWGENLENIAIEGHGLIYGKGLVRGTPRGDTKGLGDKAIALKNCHNVVLKDFSILHGGHFGILATGVDNLTIDNLIIDTNRDGIDIDCCRFVHVSNCTVNSPRDDAICPKSSFALGYARATENVTIANCIVSGFQEGSVLDGTFKPIDPKVNDKPTGRIKLGTESNGGFKNITITNCVFDHCRGLALETVDGGLLEDVTISNITMRDIGNAPIFIRLGSRIRGPEGTPVGELRRVTISNIVVYNADSKTGCIISGIPGHDIKDVTLSNIRIVYEGGGTKKDATIIPPENEDDYPEPSMFGKLPSYGFYIRHVKNIDFSNIEISHQKEDMRPAFTLNDVEGVNFRFIEAEQTKGSPVFVLKNVEDFSVFRSSLLKNIEISNAANKILK